MGHQVWEVIISHSVAIGNSWAITVHRIQRSTLDRAVIELGVKELSPDLSFVAIFWVKTLKCI
jgi:hypothetical protein